MFLGGIHQIAYVAVTLLHAIMSVSGACPSQCQCSKSTIKCIGRGLWKIPDGFPPTTNRIDLSNNPDLQIASKYFLRFKNLARLSLINCGQRGPVYLPSAVKYVQLDSNFFTVDALRLMFSSDLQLLEGLSLANNGLQSLGTKQVLALLPKSLKWLLINNNELKELTREDMLGFTKLVKLEILGSSLENIEPNTFDEMNNLWKLNLNRNKLSSLPDNIFKHNQWLSLLNLNDNNFTGFNATKLGLKHIRELKLGNNRITTFDIRHLRPLKVLLNNNKIQNLQDNIFQKVAIILVLDFSSNNIQSISGIAFRGITKMGVLLLNNNSLTSLPKGLFKGVTIWNIFLQHNQLSYFTGAFTGIRGNFVEVILAGNAGLNSLNGTEFEHLTNTSTVYLTCAQLTRVTGLSEIKAKIKCFPKADFEIATGSYKAFAYRGYQCKRLLLPTRYLCKPCKPGYHNAYTNNTSFRGICVKCPPGSYYQDEPASVSCKECKPGQYVPPQSSPGTDVSDCQTCPKGTNTTILAGTRACKCLDGLWRRYRFGPCTECNDHGYNCSEDYKRLKNGFWMTWQGTKPDNLKGIGNQSCENVYKAYVQNLKIRDDTYDRATMHLSCEMPLAIKCPMTRSCVGDIQPRCYDGYSGVLCAVCQEGYHVQFNQCVKCPRSFWASIQFVGYIALFAIFCFIVSLTEKIRIENDETSMRRNKIADHRTIADIILSSLKILIGFYQILISIIHGLSHIKWPENLKTAISILDYIQLQVIKFPSLRCINSEWNITAIDELWIALTIIITFPLLAVVCYFIRSA